MGYLAQANKADFKTLRKALIFASVMASFGVEGFSIERFEKLSKAEVNARLRELTKMTAV